MGLWVAELYYSYYYYLSFYFIQSGSGPVGSRTVVFSQVMELWVAENSAKNMCVSGFSSEKSRYALSAL